MIRETFILGIIVVCVLILSHRTCRGPRWRKGPSFEYRKLVKRFGKPNFINNNPKGAVIWKKFRPGNPFVRIMVIDESVAHYTPYKHYCYLYMTIKYDIDDENISTVLSCSESVMYDKLKSELTVRSNSLERAMMWLVLVHDINKGYIDVKNIREEIEKRSKLVYCKAKNNYTTLQTIHDEHNLKDVGYSCY